MDVYEVRRKRLRELIDTRYNKVSAAFAEKHEKQPSYISRCLLPLEKPHRKRIGEDFAREIEKVEQLPKGWMDEMVGSPVAIAIKSESELDGLELIEKGLRALVIVGRRKDEILRMVEEAREEAEQYKAAVLADLARK